MKNIKKIANEIFTSSADLEKFKRMKSKKIFFRILFRIVDPMENKSTYVVNFFLEESFNRDKIVIKNHAYLSHGTSGMGNSLSNYQNKGKFPFLKVITLKEDMWERIVKSYMKKDRNKMLLLLKNIYKADFIGAILKWFKTGVTKVDSFDMKFI